MNSDCHKVDQWLPIALAAEALGTTPLNVLMHIKRGLLSGEECEGGWLVDPESLSTLLRKRGEGAMSVVCSSGCSQKTGGCGSCA